MNSQGKNELAESLEEMFVGGCHPQMTNGKH